MARPRITPKHSYHADYFARGNSVAALPGGRAVALTVGRGRLEPYPLGSSMRLVDNGASRELAHDPVMDAWTPGAAGVVFRIGDGVAYLTNTHLIVWADLTQPPRALPIANPLPGDSFGRHREPHGAQALPGGGAAVVVLTKATSKVDMDALSRLEWNDTEARWSEPVTLSWSDIPEKPVFPEKSMERPPFIRSAGVTASGSVVIHQTGKRFLGDGGDPRYGMDWSFLLEVDPLTGRARHLANLELGYGKFTSDGERLAIRSFRGNHVHLYDLAGALVTTLPLTPRLAGGHKDPSFEDIDGRDLWCLTNHDLFHAELG
jgi:hypothetical protein